MPSTREIQQQFGFASQTAALNHLRALERQGAIRRQPGKARAVSVVSKKPARRVVEVPVYGQIAAGLASEGAQEPDGFVTVDRPAAGTGKIFALRVRGESMVGAHIVDGDTVLLEVREPMDGEVVAALIDGETTLKRYVVKKGMPYLKAENPAFRDLVPAQELVVQGVMTGLVRTVRKRAGIS